ncbi:hypothetical protein GJ496_011964 [Pomphorhynchus laevis]|nr:hypothetical protein GJ496_011964 [Pomphorhynchus laevis]
MQQDIYNDLTKDERYYGSWFREHKVSYSTMLLNYRNKNKRIITEEDLDPIDLMLMYSNSDRQMYGTSIFSWLAALYFYPIGILALVRLEHARIFQSINGPLCSPVLSRDCQRRAQIWTFLSFCIGTAFYGAMLLLYFFIS